MMMKYYDQSVEITDIPNWPDTPDHPCGILIIGREKVGVKKINNPKAFIDYL